MGKGTRSREKNRQLEQQQMEKAAEKKAVQSKKRKRTGLVLGTVAVIVALAVGTFGVVTLIQNSGHTQRSAIVAKTEHYTVNAAEAQYFFYTDLNEFKADKESYLSELMDESLSLKEQPCYYQKEITWFDYWRDTVNEEIVSYLALAEKGISEGQTLTEANKKEIEEDIASMKKVAEDGGISFSKYLANTYGRGVKEKDVRSAMELYKMAYQVYTNYYADLVIPAEELEEYCEVNQEEYYLSSYYAYTVKAEYEVTASEEEIHAACRQAADTAAYLASSASADEFKARLTAYLQEHGKTSDEIETEIGNATHSGVKNSDNTVMEAWIFSTERKAGDGKVFDSNQASTAAWIIAPVYRNVTPSRSFLNIEINKSSYDSDEEAKKKAEEIYNTLAADFSTEKFMELAGLYTDDTTIRYTNISKNGVIDVLNNWLFDANRTKGDLAVLNNETAYYVVSYVGVGLVGWQQDADSNLRMEKCSAYMTELEKALSIESTLDNYDVIVA